jgi:hypothetical protein
MSYNDRVLDQVSLADPLLDNVHVVSNASGQRWSGLDQLMIRLDQPAPARSGRLPVRVGVVGVLAALLLGGGTVAVASALRHDTEAPRGYLPHSETLGRTDPAAIAAEIEEGRRITPLPPGDQWDEVAIPDGGVDVTFGRGFFIVSVEAQAMCKWFRYYQRSRSAKDGEALAAAATVIATMSNWYTYRVAAAANGGVREQTDNIIQEAGQRGPTPTLDQYIRANCKH